MAGRVVFLIVERQLLAGNRSAFTDSADSVEGSDQEHRNEEENEEGDKQINDCGRHGARVVTDDKGTASCDKL